MNGNSKVQSILARVEPWLRYQAQKDEVEYGYIIQKDGSGTSFLQGDQKQLFVEPEDLYGYPILTHCHGLAPHDGSRDMFSTGDIVTAMNWRLGEIRLVGAKYVLAWEPEIKVWEGMRKDLRDMLILEMSRPIFANDIEKHYNRMNEFFPFHPRVYALDEEGKYEETTHRWIC